MNILFLTHTFPYPPNDGMRSTCFQLIKHLAKNNQVSLLSLIESEEELKHVPIMKQWCKEVTALAHDVPRSPLLRIQNTLFDPTPFCVVQFRSEPFRQKLKTLIRDNNYDIIQCLSVNISEYVRDFGKTPGLFFPHDSVSMQFQRNAQREPNVIKKTYLYAQAKKMKGYEKKMIKAFRKSVVVSKVDLDWIKQFVPDANIPVIPGGVDPDQFKPSRNPEEFPSVIFRGVMNFIPNIDAALYFHNQIMPHVLKVYPSLRYYIVGKEPPPSIRALHDGKNTIVTGLVEDLREYMGRSTINVCPMRGGSGMKNKILEAWSMEKPVVATNLACDGISIERGEDIMVADDPKQFADYVIELLKDHKLRDKLGKKGREKAIRQYTWAYVATLFEKEYKKMVTGQA